MKKFKVRYVRTVNEIYDAEIIAENEDEVMDLVHGCKYGEEIEGEKLVESYSDEIEVTDIEVVNE